MSNGLCKILSEKPHKNLNSSSVIFSFQPEKLFFVHPFFFFFFFSLTNLDRFHSQECYLHRHTYQGPLGFFFFFL
jgi:hypothetical protein